MSGRRDPIHLLYGLPNQRIRQRWQAAFVGVPEVAFCDLDIHGLRARPDIDCLVVSNREACEHWGACSEDEYGPFMVQFGNTAKWHGYGDRPPSIPPYVISAGSVGTFEEVRAPDMPARRLAVFLKHLESINEARTEPPIRRLGLVGSGFDAESSVHHLEASLQRLAHAVQANREHNHPRPAAPLEREMESVAARLAAIRATPEVFEAEFEAMLKATRDAYLAYLRE